MEVPSSWDALRKQVRFSFDFDSYFLRFRAEFYLVAKKIGTKLWNCLLYRALRLMLDELHAIV